MPTWELVGRFARDWERLTPQQQAAFKKAVDQMVEDFKRATGFRKGLRVKRVQGARSAV